MSGVVDEVAEGRTELGGRPQLRGVPLPAVFLDLEQPESGSRGDEHLPLLARAGLQHRDDGLARIPPLPEDGAVRDGEAGHRLVVLHPDPRLALYRARLRRTIARLDDN